MTIITEPAKQLVSSQEDSQVLEVVSHGLVVLFCYFSNVQYHGTACCAAARMCTTGIQITCAEGLLRCIFTGKYLLEKSCNYQTQRCAVLQNLVVGPGHKAQLKKSDCWLEQVHLQPNVCTLAVCECLYISVVPHRMLIVCSSSHAGGRPFECVHVYCCRQPVESKLVVYVCSCRHTQQHRDCLNAGMCTLNSFVLRRLNRMIAACTLLQSA